MQTGGGMRPRRVGPLLAAGALAVAGIAGCASGEGGRDSGKASGTEQASGKQPSDKQAEASPESDSGATAEDGPTYCTAVKKFDGLLRDVPTGNPSKVQDSLEKVSDQMRTVAAVAPNGVAEDWKKLRSGFDRLNESYALLDGISDDALARLRSSGNDEAAATELKPQQLKKYEKFRKRADSISSEVESSGEKVSEQTEKECGITIGEQ